MASCGSLIFYGKNGLSNPYSLSYGKTTIGTSADHHIRIKGDNQVSCILDTNEDGVTILVNENDEKDIFINSLPAQTYTVIVDGDHLEVGKKKFKYLNPSLDEVHLERTQKMLAKKLKTKENLKKKSEIHFNSPTRFKRLKNVVEGPSKRRFSTGSKINELHYTNTNTSTPQSASKKRFSQRMLTRKNSMLASVKENEVFDFQSPMVNCISSPIPKNKTLLGRQNKSFSGKFEFSSPPVPAKNKTYSGNISDVSENVTTPENNVTAASITPLNVSKKSKRSLNRSRTLSYVDFPDRSSTPKSAIKLNRSSSLYRPLVEDITPASPIPRSPRNSSVKKQSFTQRRSVNFNISSSTDNSSHPNFDDAEEDISPKNVKRKRDESIPEIIQSAKKIKNTSLKGSEVEDIDDQDSVHNSSLSGINHLSDTSSNSNKNNSARSSSRLKKKLSLQEDFENQSMVSWNVEMSSTDMSSTKDLEPAVKSPSASNLSSSIKYVQNQKTTTNNSKVRSKSFNLDKTTNKSVNMLSKTLDVNLVFNYEDRSVPSVFDESLESSINDLGAEKISSTPLAQTRGRISNKSIRSTRNTSYNTTRMSLNYSPITPRNSKVKGSEKEISVDGSFENSSSNSTNILFGSKLDTSLPECNDSTNKLFELMNDDSIYEDSETLGKSKLKTPTPSSNLGGNSENSFGISEKSLRSLSHFSDNDGTDVAGAKELLITPELSNSLNRVSSSKKLLKTPRVNKSPKNDLTDVRGLKKLLKTPKVYKSPKNDLTNVKGLKKLLNTPKVPKSPKNDLTNIGGVKKLLKSPKVQKSPKNDLTEIRGVKKLMSTPKNQKSPKNDLSNVAGVKGLLRSPIVQKSPKNDLTDIRGVKKLMSTPKIQKSPENDLSNVAGVRELLRSPIVQKSPRNDLTNVRGVKKLMSTPKVQNSPKNDLTQVAGVKKLMSSPKQCKTPKNDLTDIKGTKKMFKTPKEYKEPVNDLLDVRGVKQLLRTPKNRAANDSHDLSGIDILFNESQEYKFDQLLNKKPMRTYGRSPKEKKSPMEETKTPEHVLKWLEEQSNIEETPKEKVESKRKRGRKNGENQDITNIETQSSTKNRSRNLNQDILESSTNVETSEPYKVESTSNRKRKVDDNRTDIETESGPQKRGKYNKKIDQDTSQEERKNSEPMRKGRNCKKTNDSLKEPITKRSTRSNKQETNIEQVVQSSSALEKEDEGKETSIRRTNRRVKKEKVDALKTQQTDETNENKIDEKEQSIKKSTRRTKKQDTSAKEKDEVPIKRTPRKTRKGKTDLDQSKSKKADEDENNEKKTDEKKLPIRKTTRTKKHEENEEKDDKESPKKRSTRRTRKENTDLDHSKTKEIEDDNTKAKNNKKKDEKKSPIKKITRTKTIAKQKDEKETTQDGNEIKVDKESTIKRSTRKRKIEDEDAEQVNSKLTKQVVKNEKCNKENDDEQLPTKKGTKKTKKVAEQEEEQKRTTRKNKGKNQKYNEDEWDTPVKKNDQKQVSFKEVDFVQTPSIDSSQSGRSLRRRNVK